MVVSHPSICPCSGFPETSKNFTVNVSPSFNVLVSSSGNASPLYKNLALVLLLFSSGESHHMLATRFPHFFSFSFNNSKSLSISSIWSIVYFIMAKSKDSSSIHSKYEIMSLSIKVITSNLSLYS